MSIEVIQPRDLENKNKGDLLESLTAEFLNTQGYEVTQQVRVTASELDLLCKHSVAGNEIYVECKAHRDSLSANILKNLLGTVTLQDYSEGWLVSTGPLGKDAKGFLDQWEKKPQDKRNKLRIYTPERVLRALLDSKLIVPFPEREVRTFVASYGLAIGEWYLLVSPWGRYWASSVLKSGIPKSVVLYSAENGNRIIDLSIFDRIKDSDFILHDLEFIEFDEGGGALQAADIASQKETLVVEVEFGERWFDYRPARPEHFVGRRSAQRDLLHFFSDVKKQRTDTRIFAIKGDSGIGKSSLVAKLRDVARSSQKPNNLFLYAVDVRAANDSSYVHSALLCALRAARSEGFGGNGELEITNRADPIQSDSISAFLSECVNKRELVILVFDQFEELYSKAELFSVFEEVKRLMFSTIAASSNLILGFAWKTDSTVQQSHPAYHLWHELADHRFEVLLRRFSHSDAENSLAIFEQEMGEKVRLELRRYILENSQGYPWLLKKLCIHLYEQLRNGMSQHQMADRALDVASLFDQDLNNLTDGEMGCLKLVAQSAPMDWFAVLETAGHTVVQSLQQKRLLIRRGDKLNLYWDIFRDYVLSGSVPAIPFTYIPQAPSLDALIRVAVQLDSMEGKNIADLANNCKLKTSTVQNIVHDLIEFGIALGNYDDVRSESYFEELSDKSILTRLRVVFRRHRLVDILKRNNSAIPATQSDIVLYLKSLNPTAQYHTRTWNTYSNKLRQWLSILGYVAPRGQGVVYRDEGDVVLGEKGLKFASKRTGIVRRRQIFIGDAPPAGVIEALVFLIHSGPKTYAEMKSQQYRNACSILHRFGIIELDELQYYRIRNANIKSDHAVTAVWERAGCEESLKFAIEYVRKHPTARPKQLATAMAREFDKQWNDGSLLTVGKNIRHWVSWLMMTVATDGTPPNPPYGRRKLKSSLIQTTLF
jgi:hypothetical protein